MSTRGRERSGSVTHSVNHKAHLATAYNELGKELSSTKLRVVGNYTLGKVIGEGSYGKVRLGTHRLTSTRVAIKQIPKAMSAHLTREIHHHRTLHHPHLTQMYEVLATESSIWIVTELCSGGELFDYLAEKGRIAEGEARRLFGELCLAVAYLHERGIVHRDLKLENVLMDERCRIKVGDFGFTREWEKGLFMETFCGTTGYAAPEMLLGKKYQGPEVDVWSLGIILYCLLTGSLPFDDDDEALMRKKIIKGEFEDPEWLSTESRDLIAHILQQDPTKRLSIPQILAHPWFTTPIPSPNIDTPPQGSADPPSTHPDPYLRPDTELDALAHAHMHPDSDDLLQSPIPFTSSYSYPYTYTHGTNESPPPSPLEFGGGGWEHHGLGLSVSVVSTSAGGFVPGSLGPSTASTSASTSTISGHTFHSTSTSEQSTSDRSTSPPTTPDDIGFDPFGVLDHTFDRRFDRALGVGPGPGVVHRSPSEITLKKTPGHDGGHAKKAGAKAGLTGGNMRIKSGTRAGDERRPTPLVIDEGSQPQPSEKHPHTQRTPKAPPYPARTPIRTKRRSVSSTLSSTPTPSPTHPHPHAPGDPPAPLQDFASLLHTPAPIIFSTPLEQELLNRLSGVGFDAGQIVHSVLSDACDAAGAVWWMVKRKAEKAEKERERAEKEREKEKERGGEGCRSEVGEREEVGERGGGGDKGSQGMRDVLVEENVRKLDTRSYAAIGVQTEHGSTQTPTHAHALSLARSAPQLAFLPPTPTISSRPMTPPKRVGGEGWGGGTRPLLSPPGSSERSYPNTPGSLRGEREKEREREKDKEREREREREREGKRREGKARSGSVSIMQRATTALEAAGLVRKKSSEAVREEKEKEKEREKDRERERSKEIERKMPGGEEARSSYGSGSSRLTKSPPLKAAMPSTPPPSELHHPQPQIGSPWVLAGRSPLQSYAPTPANSPGAPSPAPLLVNAVKVPPGPRNRANLLTAFRLWFHEDRKGKRKESAIPSSGNASGYPNRPMMQPSPSYNSGNKRFASRSGSHRAQRASVSSRRSSSVNSRRSSGTSAQMITLDSPHPVLDQAPAHRRSFGTHTPNSERGEYSSRPSSVRSFSMPRHRKSPSASSAGSAHFRATSPIQKYHRRAGSGSSTRVVRQTQGTPRSPHMRSNSATSSVHSLVSSRPASYYDPSESDGPRTSSPFKAQSKRPVDDPRRSTYGTTFVAQKRQAPFMSPVGYITSLGRSSWKKSWGLEPPGWQSRTAHIPIEVLAISPVVDGPNGLRDVFSGRQSISLGDESDWVDEDDDIPAFAGGLGQLAASTSTSAFGGGHVVESSVTLSPAPRGHRQSAKRMNRNSSSSSGSGVSTCRQKAGHSPVERASPIPADNTYDSSDSRGGRRQLPGARSGPAFRAHAIQEEDEGEEE